MSVRRPIVKYTKKLQALHLQAAFLQLTYFFKYVSCDEITSINKYI